MEITDVNPVPRLRYPKAKTPTQENQAKIDQHLEHYHDEILPSPIEISSEQKTLLGDLINFQSNWIKQQLGISVDSRIPSTDKIRFTHRKTTI